MTYTSAEVDTFPELVDDLIKLHSRIVGFNPDEHAFVPWYFCKECLHLYPCKTISTISQHVSMSLHTSGCLCGKPDCDVEDQETGPF